MKSTFSRTFTTAALILLAALLLVGASFQFLVKKYLTEQTVSRLQTDAKTVTDLAEAYFSQGQPSDQSFLVNLSVASRVSGADMVICNPSGTVLLCSCGPLGCEHQGLTVTNRSFLNKVLSGGGVDTGLMQGLYDDVRYVVSAPILDSKGAPHGLILVSTPTVQVRSVVKRMSNMYLSVSVLVVLVAVCFMTLIARQQAKPLREMANAASAFGRGNLQARVQVDEDSSLELQKLALAFNNMASSLQKSEYRRQEFVANVSHELKTPMTTIGGYIDGMLDGTIPPERHRQCMQLVSDESKRLSRLVRSMLYISRLPDQEIPEEKKTRFDICERAGQVLIAFEQKITQKDVNVEVAFPEHPVFTFADEDSITQVLYNLVDNGVKFCPAGGVLGLQIQFRGAKIYVTVSNDGETIPAQELPLVFDRFHKLDKSRSQNREGWGLGLYIVKTLIGSHGEDISVSSRDGKTAFTFTLPLVN